MNTEKGKLYIVGIPIGNYEDITLRAKRILSEVNAVLCEDTRRTGRFFLNIGIKQSLVAFHSHNQKKKLALILRRLGNGESFALITDSGTPSVSDPGSLLVNESFSMGIQVIPLPGASAPIVALSVSGFPPLPLVFLGFLSPKRGKRKKGLERWSRENFLVIVLESPYRLVKLLQDAYEIYNDCPVFIGHEMTKLYESFHKGTISTQLDFWQKKKPKGEFTLIFWPVGENNTDNGYIK